MNTISNHHNTEALKGAKLLPVQVRISASSELTDDSSQSASSIQNHIFPCFLLNKQNQKTAYQLELNDLTLRVLSLKSEKVKTELGISSSFARAMPPQPRSQPSIQKPNQ